jgi:GrpB-like predicted nucleotidyltransferase (UPF0157 family)
MTPRPADYARIKHGLAERHRDDRVAYTDAKQLFIWAVIAQADLWAQEIGWTPGSSDA